MSKDNLKEQLEQSGDKEITVPASTLLNLIKQNEEITNRLNRIDGAPATIKKRGKNDKVVRIGILDGKVVTGWTSAKQVYNPERRVNEDWIKVFFEGEKEPKKMLHQAVFRNIDIKEVPVVKEETEEREREDGTTERTTISKSGYSTAGTGEIVPMIETYDVRTFTVKHPLDSAKELIIGAEFVNPTKIS